MKDPAALGGSLSTSSEPRIRRSASQTLITGVYRTGGEFVTQLVNCHPHISATMYGINAMRFIQDRYDPFHERENYVRALEDLEWRMKERYRVTFDKAALLEELARVGRLDYGTFVDVVASSIYLKGDVRHWAELNKLLWREIERFLEVMPHGRAILVLRDPRAILLSFKKMTYAEPPAYLGAVFNCLDALLHGMELTARLPADRFLCVRYEDAARDPVGMAHRLWKFLGLGGDYRDVDVLDQSKWRGGYGERWRANSSFHSNDDARPFDVSAAMNRWRTLLSAAEISLAEGVCGEAMAGHGYERTLAPPDWPAAMRLIAADDTMMGHFRNWLLTGCGIEAFPTDPLVPANWR